MIEMRRRAIALMLATLMAASGTGVANAAAEIATVNAAQSISAQAVTAGVKGTLRTAPAKANLEELGPLGWIHFNNKVLDDCAKTDGDNQITDYAFSGNMAQIAEDTRTNFAYTGADAKNTKGQVVNGKGGSFTFRVPGSTEPRYLRTYIGSWASEVTLTLSINGEAAYSKSFGKTATSSGADCFLSSIQYQTGSENDDVTVTVEITDTFSSGGNMSIQAIALSDQLPEDSNLASGEVLDVPAVANLTKLGNLDWVNLDNTNFERFNHKNTETPAISNLKHLGSGNSIATNAESSFIFVDGTSPEQVLEGNHKSLVFTGQDNGMEFTVPASVETRYLTIFTGAWAADITAELSINGEVQYSETYGSSVTTSGTPAKYNMLRIAYQTLEADDEVTVKLWPSHTYDSNWGNMNISAIALSDRLVEDDGSIVGGKVSSAPLYANLTKEGNLDWAYFNNGTFDQYNRKAGDSSLITNVAPHGTPRADPVMNNGKTGYSFTDGANPASGNDLHEGYVFVGDNGGVSFNVPGGPDMKYLSLYTGEWAADITLELLVNGEVQYSETYGSDVTTAGTPAVCNVARLQYSTPSADDTVEVRVLTSEVYDTKWGNMSIQAVTLSDTAPVSANEKITTEDWEVDHTGGQLQSLKAKIAGEMYTIPVRTDERGGFLWKYNGTDIPLVSGDADPDGNVSAYSARYQKNGEDLTFTMRYSVSEEKQLVVTASVTNNKDTEQPVDKLSLNLGFNTYLERYPQYNDQLFPTLLRCEKTHLWGYFSTPSGRLMTVATDAPVASYSLDYQSGAHRIYTASLDVLQSGELPERHPENLDHLGAKETKTWNVYLKPVEDLNAIEKIKPTIAQSTGLPTIDADRYTMAEGEQSRVTILSETPLKDGKATLVAPDGTESALDAVDNGNGTYTCTFDAADKDEGVYKLWAENEAGYRSEGTFSIRKSWSWYTQQARKAAVEAPQKAASHTESWYGLYSAYIAKKYFPDAELDDAIDEKFEEIYPLMYDVTTDLPTAEQSRIQNHSGMLGVFVDKFQSSGNWSDLESAVNLAEYVISSQRESGGYYNGGTDYTSVIYPAKSIMELMHVEQELKDDPSLTAEDRAKWTERYDRHFASVTRAMDNLVRRDGHFETEGQQTFEDGANSCSATQLTEFALMFPEGSAEREKYTNAALKIMGFHTSHQQSIIPDSRINGGTLRFWEAQYDVNIWPTEDSPNMMNSPHGWSGWNIYALFNLYELTGDQQYLERGMNAMGSCAQLMSFDGTLRWAFVPDPYRKTRQWVKDEEASQGDVIKGKYIDTVIGEEYVDMISYWWRAPKNTWVPGYGTGTQGAACDNDVHEIFKALGEVALTKAYVAQNADGSFETYNCSVEQKDGGLVIIPNEDVVSNVSVQVNADTNVTVKFYDGDKSALVAAGLPAWVSTKENAADLQEGDKDSSLSGISISKGTFDKEFQKDVLDYTLDVGSEGGAIEITPAASSENATVYVNGTKVLPGESYTLYMNAFDTKVIPVVVKSQYQTTKTTYTLAVTSMGDYENVALKAGSVTATRIQGPATNPMSLIDGNHGKDGSSDTHITVAPGGENNLITLTWEEPQSFQHIAVWTFYGAKQGPTKWDYQISKDNGATWETVAADVTAEWKYETKEHENKVVSLAQPVTDVTNLRMVLKAGLAGWGNTCITEIEAFGKEETQPTEHSISVSYSGRQAKLTADGEAQKLADLIGSYKAVLQPNATSVLTFAPAVEGREFAGVTVNGAAQEDFTPNAFSMTFADLTQDANVKIDFTVVNKMILRTVIDTAAQLIDSDEFKLAAPTVQANLRNKLAAAQAVESNKAATQASIDTAWGDLIDAIHLLSFELGNTDSLKELVESAGMLTEGDYTAESWAAMQAKLQAANVVLGDKEPLKADVDKAYKELRAAVESLVRQSDLSSLQAVIGQADIIVPLLKDQYLAVGQEEFLAALEAAKTITGANTPAEISEALDRLTNAMMALRIIPDKSYLKENIKTAQAVDADAFTAESVQRLNRALSNALAVLNSDTADQKEVDAANDGLTAAYKSLERKDAPKPNSNGKGSSSKMQDNSYGSTGVISAAGSVQNAAAYVRSDTTMNFTLKRGQAYCFKMTVVNGNTAPSFTVGDGSVLKTQYVAKVGNDYYYRVWATGTPGQSTGVYTTLLNGAPQKHCVVSIA